MRVTQHTVLPVFAHASLYAVFSCVADGWVVSKLAVPVVLLEFLVCLLVFNNGVVLVYLHTSFKTLELFLYHLYSN